MKRVEILISEREMTEKIDTAIIKKFGSMKAFIAKKIISYPILALARKRDLTIKTKMKLEKALGEGVFE